MHKPKKIGFLLLCPKSGKLVGLNWESRLTKWLFPLVGLIALGWYLIRVLPKPSRADYPCQRVAMPLAFSFLSYLASWAILIAAFRKAQTSVRQYRWIVAICCVLVGLSATFWNFNQSSRDSVADFEPTDNPNEPIGVAQGIHAGRVAWAHDPDATSWDGTTLNWWNDEFSDQAVINNMLALAVYAMSASTDVGNAWDEIFRYFNQKTGKGTVGYQSGETIAIKINLNNRYNVSSNQIDASPHLAYAMLDQLVNVVGAAQTDIVIYDAQRSQISALRNYCVTDFPSVGYNTWGSWVANAIQYSAEVTDSNARRLPSFVVNCDYLINMAVLKRHDLNHAITVCGKNHFGTCGNPSALHTSVRDFNEPMGGYNPMIDFIGSQYIGGKTLLYIIDGLYAGNRYNAVPTRWAMDPFNNDWPSSIFVSQDPVAIDSVGLDFMHAEWVLRDNADNYLHEAALVPSPPSGTAYRPDGVALTESPGVHEHWNNRTNKQYSRNLGMGNGIELVKVDLTPELVSSMDPVILPTVIVGTVDSTSRQFNISIKGTQTLNITSATVTGAGFSLIQPTAGDFPISLQLAQVREFEVGFDHTLLGNPSATGVFQGALSITRNGVNSAVTDIAVQVEVLAEPRPAAAERWMLYDNYWMMKEK